MSELAQQANSLSSLLGDHKTSKEMENNQEISGRGNITGLTDVIQMETQV